jgi:hypothetical protein
MDQGCWKNMLSTKEICYYSVEPILVYMRNILPPAPVSRMKGTARHYQKSPIRKKTWEEWVEGDRPPSDNVGRAKSWLKIAVIIIALLSLCGIVTGLLLELA